MSHYTYRIEAGTLPIDVETGGDVVIAGPNSRFNLNQALGTVEFHYDDKSLRRSFSSDKIIILKHDLSASIVITRTINK